MATLGPESDTETDADSDSGSQPPAQSAPDHGTATTADGPTVTTLTLDDFLPRPTDQEATIEELNAFFNSSQIKQELHWFTHRDTLERAFEREDRELFHIRPQDSIVAAAMVWCTSRVLDTGQAQIRLIATTPRHRGHGLARMLVTACISFAQSHGQHEMIADVAQASPATAFWKACGFVTADSYETDGGRSMLRMRRDI